MSWKDKNKVLAWGYGYVMNEYSIDVIVGKVLTIVDTMGLKENQEKASKDLIRQAIREEFFKGIWISPKTNGEIHDKYNKMRDEQVPCGAV